MLRNQTVYKSGLKVRSSLVYTCFFSLGFILTLQRIHNMHEFYKHVQILHYFLEEHIWLKSFHLRKNARALGWLSQLNVQLLVSAQVMKARSLLGILSLPLSLPFLSSHLHPLCHSQINRVFKKECLYSSQVR